MTFQLFGYEIRKIEKDISPAESPFQFAKLLVEISKVSVRTNFDILQFLLDKKKFPVSNAIFSNKERMFATFIEGIFIKPSAIHLAGMYLLSRAATKVSPHSSNYFVELTRFVGLKGADKNSCDWCSIINGIMENLERGIKETKDGDAFVREFYENKPLFVWVCAFWVFLKSMIAVPGSSLFGEVITVNPQEYIDQNEILISDKNAQSLKIALMIFLETKKGIAHIESRWCPFGYLRNVNYNREYWGNELWSVVEVLRQHGKVSCEQCVQIANAGFQGDDNDSVFDTYLKLITKE